jgi:hypothetical protein
MLPIAHQCNEKMAENSNIEIDDEIKTNLNYNAGMQQPYNFLTVNFNNVNKPCPHSWFRIKEINNNGTIFR